jgi:hypothetical protein
MERFRVFDYAFEMELGLETNTVDLIINDDFVRFYEVMMGPQVERDLGDFDHEYWIDVPASHIKQLVAVLARHAFNAKGPVRLSGLRTQCEAAGIPVKTGMWT